MNLTYKIIDKNQALLERIDALARAVFPPDELIAPMQILEYGNNDARILAFFDDDTFVGFSALFSYKNLAYLGFLAIEPYLQGRGYGRAILQNLKDIYKDKIIVLEIEKLDENAPNNAQRIKRAKFYERAGFIDSGHDISYLGVTYQVYSNSLNFDIKVFKAMFEEFSKNSNFKFILN